MSPNIVFNGIVITLAVDPTVGEMFPFHTLPIECITFDKTTTRALFDVNAFGGDIGSDLVVDDMIPIALILFAVRPVVQLS